MVQFAGKYKQVKEENYENFLKALELNLILRKAAQASNPIMEISEQGPGKWKIVNSTILKSIVVEFEDGKPFDEETTDGRKCTTTFKIEGDRWVTEQKNKKEGGPDVHVVREFSDAGIDVTVSCKDVVAKLKFARQ